MVFDYNVAIIKVHNAVINFPIGVNLSERKSGTERTKKRKKRELVFSLPPGGGAPPGGKEQAKQTTFYKNIHDPIKWCSCITKYTVSESMMSLFVSCNDIVGDIAERNSFAEHGNLVAESSEFHLTLSRAHNYNKAHFFQLEIRKKSGTF